MIRRGLAALLIFALMGAFGQASASRMLSADGSHILALDGEGNVWAWGSNRFGESLPESGEACITAPQKVFENAAFIAAGQHFSMAVDKNHDLYLWGDGADGKITKLKSGVSMIDACDGNAIAVTVSGELLSWGTDREETKLSEGVKKAAAGMDFVLALMENGDVYEYSPDGGEGKRMLSGAADIDASGQSRYAVTPEGSLYAWGGNGNEGRLGIPGTEWAEAPVQVQAENVKLVRSGLTNAGCIDQEGSLYAWGALYAYLTGYDEETGISASLMDGELIHYGNTPVRLYEGVEDAAFGDAFAAILFENGDVFTFGTNDYGQIGNGLFTETMVVEGEEEGEYELSIISSFEQIFPYCPIRLAGQSS